MTWDRNQYKGTTEDRSFHLRAEQSQEIKGGYEVCKIEFSSSIFIGRKVRVKVSGHRALSLISTHGSIEIISPIDVSGSEVSLGSSVNTMIGGYVKTLEDGADAGKERELYRVEYSNL